MHAPLQSPSTRPRLQGLGVACALGIAFMLLSFLRTLGDTGSMKFGDVAIRTAMETPLWGTSLGRSLAYFVFAQLLAHLTFAALCWALACLTHYAWPGTSVTRRQWVLIWFIAGAAWVMLANASLFPTSSLGEPYSSVGTMHVFGLPLYLVAGFGLAAAISICLIRCLANPPLRRTRIGGVAVLSVIISAGVLGVFAMAAPSNPPQATQTNRPHVIIIGIDSMRADLATGPDAAMVMPNLAAFLTESVVFNDAMTPLARTFPSWVSILTGKHPHTTGAVVNLLPREMIRTGTTLPQALRDHGYQAFYAIDESRFSNIDETYGFDRIAAPPFGAADFLLSTISDAPLTNLIVNTRLGAWLTPNSYANRGAAMLYDPDTFIDRVSREAQFDRPTFLAVHLTLAHWPFTWARSPRLHETHGPARLREKYYNAAHRVDRQFGDLLELLRSKGAFENAIVVVLSDHGEALGDPDETRYPYEIMGENRDTVQINGHGTSVFSPHQYQVLFAMRSFGNSLLKSRCGPAINAPVSVVDVYPTMMDALGIESQEQFDGRSLVPLLAKSASTACATFQDRIRFTETEFNPPGITPDGPISASAIEKVRYYYDVLPSNGRMQIRREIVPTLLKQRQYAAIMGESMVAAVPVPGDSRFRYFISDQKTRMPREIAGAPDSASDPVASKLYEALQFRFSLAPRS